MERLTTKREADAQREAYERRIEQGYPRNIPEERFLKLAAYEDTGLEPDEITDYLPTLKEWRQNMGALRHVRELVTAEAEGRLVMLPCKVGDGRGGEEQMTECVERRAVLDIVTEWCPDDDGSVGKTGDLRDMLDELEAIPAADVVEVVRCPECVHHVDCGYHFCNMWCANCPDDSDFFCAYGERDGGVDDA